MTLFKATAILVEAQSDLTLVEVCFGLLLDFTIHEVVMIAVEILCVYLKHGEMFTNIETNIGKYQRIVRKL